MTKVLIKKYNRETKIDEDLIETYTARGWRRVEEANTKTSKKNHNKTSAVKKEDKE